MFRLYDRDRSGFMDKDEFAKGLRKYGVNATKAEMDELFSAFDTDYNGTVNYEEFLRHIRVRFIYRKIRYIYMYFSNLPTHFASFSRPCQRLAKI